MAGEYAEWNNERLDDILSDKPLTRLTDVTGWNDKVTIKCEVCENVYETTPYILKQGAGCPRCARRSRRGVKKKAKYSVKEVKTLLAKSNLKLINDEEYKNTAQQIGMECLKCGHQFTRTVMSVMRGYDKCPSCKGTGEPLE